MHTDVGALLTEDKSGLDLMQRNEVVCGLYRGLLGRKPEPEALAFWSEAIRDQGDIGAVARAIVSSPEYVDIALHNEGCVQIKAEIEKVALSWLKEKPITIVDVGAKKLAEEDHIYHPLLCLDPPCRVIGFEPQDDDRLASVQSEVKEDLTVFPTFIGDGKSHVFHINNVDATSSLLPFNAGVTKTLVGLSHLKTNNYVQVETQTLDQTLSNVDRIDFLKLDIQGFEFIALQHGYETLSRTNVVHCEVSFAEIYKGQALFSEVENLMRKSGFYFLDFSSYCRYPYHCESDTKSSDRLGWCDAIFLRRSELITSPRDLVVQSFIATLIYEKYSLAEHLLSLSQTLMQSSPSTCTTTI